ncbi:glucosamine-6-phosphate deaminase [Streptococcus cuniculipharyngis]|uniref:Glucosamine-6-phosphate deaminase n=1 Tax=Streptococcus cuniculipharyngis TaxID=1562651 RepID=A0A5C5SCI4_9STRE|nr:glucosamine-6-phosphate deaminase [Streptococcus cuniculipharyngis]TWS98676.1 glucosamine-6-phosphate deaminase [Streptococcus cuniculipharyngis]
MKLVVVDNQQAGSKIAFDVIAEKIKAGAQVLGLATGSSPIALYQQMVASSLDFSRIRTINLDEYVGLSAQDQQSYHYFMEQQLFGHRQFKEHFLPNGLAEDLVAETERYNQVLQAYPIDVQILGLGQNGHIGFNEPGTPFDSQTHVVDLAASTIQANARFFENSEQVPRQAISMGIASIMSAKSIILMAYGLEKAAAVKAMVEGPVNPDLPASILQEHDDVLVILDQEAASQLSQQR